MDNKPVFGIDLGTTNSAISVVQGGNKPKTIELFEKDSDKTRFTMPSCVMWKDGEFIIGIEAYNNRANENVCYSIKRVMQEPDATFTFKDGDKELTLSAVDISAEILKGIVSKTNGVYGDIEDVVITVPAYFDQIGRDNTRAAALKAGLNPIDIINEPTAAALLYDTNIEEKTKDVVVYDLGGGTFDVTLARITMTENNVLKDFYQFDDSDDNFPKASIKVLATDGNSKLGGDDIDIDMLNIVLGKLEDAGYDTSKIPKVYKEYMILQLEALKKGDSMSNYQYYVGCKCTDGSKIDTYVDIEPTDFLNALKPSLNKTIRLLDKVLNSVQHDCKTIVLIGGSTKNPWLVRALSERYGDKFSINCGYDPDKSVAEGAAVYGKSVKFGNASVQVFDILSIPIGVALGEEFSTIIPAGSILPTSGSIVVETAVDYQTSVSIELYQGTSRTIDNCTFLGKLFIDNIPPKLIEETNIVITINISSKNILTCTATIDNITKELPPLDLGGSRQSSNAVKDRKSKQIKRWKTLTKTLREEGNIEVADKLSVLVEKYENGNDSIKEDIITLLESM